MNELNSQTVVEEEGMTLQELFSIVWLNRALIFWVTLWIAVLGVVYTYVFVTPVYEAETSLIVQVDVTASGSTEQSAIYVAQNLIETYKVFVVSNTVLTSVIDDVDALPADYSLTSLKNSITINSSSNVLIFTINVENQDPELAAEIANRLVENSIAIANDTESGYVLLQNKLKLLDMADVPSIPSAPNKILNIVISVLLGGIVSLGIVFVRELFNNKFQSSSEMEKFLGIKIIAAVPGTMKERKLVE
ncbi:MAG: hypothetical protein JXL85_02195 [Bacilli bacterium]|nr:hypothetical protein [Bacilli bacterium]